MTPLAAVDVSKGATREPSQRNVPTARRLPVPLSLDDRRGVLLTCTVAAPRKAVRTRVPVTIGQIARVDATLEGGALTETVTVASEAQLLQTGMADVRNQFEGPGGYNVDLSLFRSFPMDAQRRLEARIEAGNVLNHAVYNNPNGSFTSGTFGRVTGTSGSYPERQVRLEVRFSF